MRKNRLFLVLSAAIALNFVFTSCDNGFNPFSIFSTGFGNSPSSVAKTTMNAMLKKDVTTLAKNLYGVNASLLSQRSKEEIEYFKSTLDVSFVKVGKVISEVIEGEGALVQLEVVHKNGEVVSLPVLLIKTSDGWKVLK